MRFFFLAFFPSLQVLDHFRPSPLFVQSFSYVSIYQSSGILGSLYQDEKFFLPKKMKGVIIHPFALTP